MKTYVEKSDIEARIKVCGALWKEWDDGSWSLRSERCGSCCDNEVMGNQIEPLPKFS